jgi:FixJ family two-component response regulator
MIYIVDDDYLVREAVKSLVQSLGYEVEAIASAEEYLASDCARTASCVITDVQMPGITGLDFHNRLIANGDLTPVIFMSGFPSEKISAHIRESGAVGFLCKPIARDKMKEHLTKALNGTGLEDH